MIYIICSEKQYKLIMNDLCNCGDHCYFGDCVKEELGVCAGCIEKHIKRINTDIKPDTPNYKTEAENTAFLQGFDVAVKKMRGEV